MFDFTVYKNDKIVFIFFCKHPILANQKFIKWYNRKFLSNLRALIALSLFKISNARRNVANSQTLKVSPSIFLYFLIENLNIFLFW